MGGKIKIGPITYSIVAVSGLRSDDGKSLYGEVKYGLCEVRIEADNSPQQDRQTLWHEIVHIILEQLGRSKLNEENLVDSLAYALMQVVQDNPWLAEEAK